MNKFDKTCKKYLYEVKGIINMDVVLDLRKAIKKLASKLNKKNIVPSLADIEDIAKKHKLKYTDMDLEYIEDEIEDILKGKV